MLHFRPIRLTAADATLFVLTLWTDSEQQEEHLTLALYRCVCGRRYGMEVEREGEQTLLRCVGCGRRYALRLEAIACPTP